MNINYAAVVIASLLLSCSPNKSDQPEIGGWDKYTSYSDVRGFKVKPLIVHYAVSVIKINDKTLDSEQALVLIKQSQDIYPVPDILIRMNLDAETSGKKFMSKISENGLCHNRSCFYQIKN